MKRLFLFISCFYTIQLSECLRFDSAQPNEVKVNISQTAIMKFRYIFESEAERTPVPRIKCGYDDSGFKELLVKQRTITVSPDSSVPQNLRSRVKGYQDSTDPELIGVQIDNVRATDPRNFLCEASYSRDGNILEAESPTVVLKVFHPPEFVECLKDIRENQAHSISQQLPIQCYATGNPTPSMKCQLIAEDGSTVIQESNGGFRVGNISTSFSTFYRKQTVNNVEIPIVGTHVVCTATGQDSGTKNESKRISFAHAPFPPRNVTQYTPDNAKDNTIYLRWSPVPKSERGGGIRGFKITYYIKNQRLTSEKSKDVNKIEADSDGYITAEITPVNSSVEYIIIVQSLSPRNTNLPVVPGFSQAATLNDITVSKPVVTEESSSSDTGAIVGGVVGGIVFIVVFIIVCVYCSRKSEKKHHYPTSYVEDAVDYPRNDNKNLYSSVEKKQRKVSETDSTSGYPDVVTSNNGDVAMRNKSSSYSYEPSSKAYV